MIDMVNAPPHYKEQSVMLEPIDVLRWAPFDLGNALKYIIRAKKKGNEKQDLLKAQYYIRKAQESLKFNSEFYFSFLSKYGFLLERFENVPAYSGDCEEYLSKLNLKIKFLISMYNTSNNE